MLQLLLIIFIYILVLQLSYGKVKPIIGKKKYKLYYFNSKVDFFPLHNKYKLYLINKKDKNNY